MSLLLRHDHFFILTQPGAVIAERLVEIGLVEGSRNQHPGQGTANRRFFLANSTLELLFIDDADEASTGPARQLNFVQRLQDADASPFGLIVRDESGRGIPPFPGWPYCPDYFPADTCFHVGENAAELREPLCLCMPTNLPAHAVAPVDNPEWQLTALEIDIPLPEISAVLQTVANCAPLSLRRRHPHHLTVELNSGRQHRTCDLRPELPLSLHY